MYYPEELKLEVVDLIATKKLTKAEARHKYSIKGHSTIDKWLKKYVDLSDIKKIKRGKNMKQEKKNQDYKSRIRKLEKLLADKELELEDYKIKSELLEKIIELAEDDLKIKIKKNIGQSESKI